MSNELLEERSSAIVCPKCGQPLVNVATSAVCANGCGRLYPKVSPQDNRKAQAFHLKKRLPGCHAVDLLHQTSEKGQRQRVYVVEGNPGLWKRVKRSKSSISSAYGQVIAILGEGLVELARDTKTEYTVKALAEQLPTVGPLKPAVQTELPMELLATPEGEEAA